MPAELRAKIRELDDEHLKRLSEIAKDGEDKDSVAAIKLMWSYAHGNPHQVVTGDDGGPVRVDIDVLAMLRKLATSEPVA